MRGTSLFLLGLLLGFSVFAGWQRTMGVAEEARSASYFTDVEQGSYYDDSVLGMVRKGIIRGYDNGRFGPHDFVTRAQATVMLERYHHNVVRPLQEKVEFILKHLDLGRCGDRSVDVGEECDDGNREDGDGCSSECLEEKQPKPPEAETKRCVVTGCSGQLCVEEGVEVLSICDWRPEHACYARARCERQPDGECGWTETPEFLACLGHGNGAAFCDEKKEKLSDFIRSRRACRTDDDCSVLVRDCTPFLTCGKVVSTGFLGEVQKAIAAYVEVCETDGPLICVDCVPYGVVCDKGRCRPDPPVVCSGEARVCPDGSVVSRNPDLECAFDPCPETSSCGNDVCEEGEAGVMVDPGGCGPDAPPECLGPPAQFRVGTCPEDCE